MTPSRKKIYLKYSPMDYVPLFASMLRSFLHSSENCLPVKHDMAFMREMVSSDLIQDSCRL